MQLKTVSSIGLAFLLVFGVVGVASAQEVAATQGIIIRVDKPATGNTWVKIGDNVVVRVLTYDGRLDQGFVVSVRDSTLGDAATAGEDGAEYLTFTVPGNASDATPETPRRAPDPADGWTKGLGSGVDTFTVTIPVPAADQESDNNHAVKVVVNPTAAGEGPLNNLMTDKKITPATAGFGATIVGDGKKFGIDQSRPVQAAVFSSIRLDRGGEGVEVTIDGSPGSADSTDVTAVELSVGDEIEIVLGLNTPALLGADATQILVGIKHAVADSTFDTAPIKYELGGDKLYETSAKVSGVLEEGKFGNNVGVEIHAVIVDRAGNLGAATADAAAPAPTSAHTGTVLPDDYADNFTITADGTTPTITMNYPHPDSAKETRITAVTAQDIQEDYTFETGNSAPSVNPLHITLSEEVDSILVTHGDSTRGFGRFVDADDVDGDGDTSEELDPTGSDSTAMFALDIGYTAAGGTSGDLKVTVWDLLGNKAELVNDAIVHDGVKPTISNLFPTAMSAPKDPENDNAPTFNLTTKDPVFQFDEELDSLAVRYRGEGGARSIMTAGWSRGNVDLENTGQLVTFAVNDTTFQERQRYTLEVLAVDKAGNASVASSGVLTFKKGFGNPSADQFKIVAAPEEKQVAGEDITLTMSVLDTTLSKQEDADVRAVTYHTPSAVAVIVPGAQADALDGVSFSGTGVSEPPVVPFALPAELAGMAFKAAILDGDGWHAGQREVKVKSTKPLVGAMIMAAEGAPDPATGMIAVRITGQAAEAITVEVAEFSAFTVTAREGQIAGSNVAGAFTVNVLPVDAYGNASTKQTNTVGADTWASVAVNFSSNNSAVSVPSGQQSVAAGGTDFGAVAADISGSATITVRTVDDIVTGAGTDDEADAKLMGSVTVNIVTEGGEDGDPGAPAAPANIVVQDYKGADGEGDQGGVVVISFPNSSQHEAVSAYQISREIDSTTGVDDEGNVVELEEPVKKWVAWTSVSFDADAGDEMGDAEGDMQTVIVPAIDNVATNWGVTAVTAAGESDMTTASKRVFTKESIQQTLQLLGMPEAELLTDEELNRVFNAPEDYVKSLIGDQKNVIFAPVNPDVSALVGNAAVPANIRTGHAGSFLSSARTVTEEPVAAVDDIAPAAVTDASGTGAGGVILTWTASASEGIVDYIPYRSDPNGDGKYMIPIMGVKGYTVMRGASADALESAGTLAPGSTRFTDDNLPDGATSLVYRIDAFDDNNVAMSDLITVENISVRVSFVDANGDPVYLMVLPAQGGNLEVDFEDILAFGAAFGSKKGDANYNPQADVNDDGSVDFADLATAAATFGKTAVLPSGSKLAVVPQRPGVNADTEMTLELTGDKVLVGETITLTVSMANAKALNGYGLELAYDADKFEFVSAVPAENDLLKSDGGETPLFKNWPEEGRVSVVNLITESGTVSGEGALVTFTFKVLREFEDNARFEIAQGVVFDGNQLQNPVVTLGALDVQSTPTEFALHQNYPNPFNPQTNIPYDLAEGGDVVLRIYNLLGQEVRTLVRERQAPGRYTVQWSGMDDRGVSVSSGIYFYQVSVAGKFQDAKRLMLLK